jgi:serine/threonine protein kinase
MTMLFNISKGLEDVHQKKIAHHDFHAGNILLSGTKPSDIHDNSIHISDMGLCRDVSNTDKNNIYGVIPYVAPEVLKGEPYTQAADVYSFGMIMYFVATGKQPFANRAHDEYLVLNICSGNRPEINVTEAPKCYIDLMKQCWGSNPNKRPKVDEIHKLIRSFCSYKYMRYFEDIGIEKEQFYEIKKQFKEAEEYKRSHPSLMKVSLIHKLFIHHDYLILLQKISRNMINISNNIVEIIDFTK